MKYIFIIFNVRFFNRIRIFKFNTIFLEYINRTPLFHAIELGNIEIIKLLLSNDKIDVNQLYIFRYVFLLIKF